jgi:hypothetical protein
MAGYRVQFENGQAVDFDTQPTQADIDEAYHHISGAAGAEAPGTFHPAEEAFRAIKDNIPQGVKETMGEIGGTLKDAFMPGATPFGETPKPSGTSEAVGHMATSIPGFVGGLVGAAVEKPIAAGFGNPVAPYDQRVGEVANRLTYDPKSDIGQDMSKPFDELMYRAGAPMLGHMADFGYAHGSDNAPIGKSSDIPVPSAKIGTPVEMGLRTKPKQLDVVGAVSDVLKTKPDIDLNEGPNLPPVIRVNKEGQGDLLPTDPGFAEAVKRGLPPEQPGEAGARVFDEMQGQLRNGENEPINLARNNSIPDVATDLRARPAQVAVDARQAEADFAVKRQQSLDFNAAERARQENAPVPGLDTQAEMAKIQDELQSLKEAKDKQEISAQDFQDRVNQAMDRLNAISKPDQPLLADKPINSTGPIGRQRGAIDIREIIDGIRRFNLGDRIQMNDGRVGKVVGDRFITQPNPEKFASRYAEEISKLVDRYGLDHTFGATAEAAKQAISDRIKKELANDQAGYYIPKVDFGDGRAMSALPSDIKARLDGPRLTGPISSKGPIGRQRGAVLFEGKKRKALENLNDKLKIETKLREIAPSQWTPEDAIREILKVPDVNQNIVQRGINFLTKGGQYMAMKVHHPLLRYLNEKVQTADRLSRADIRDHVFGSYGPAVRALTDKELADIWHVIDVADHNKAPIDLVALAKRGATEAQIHMVETHQKEMAYTLQSINAARAARGKGPVDARVAYAAMQAGGDFRRLVWDKKGGDVVGIITSDFRPRLNSLMKKMNEKGYYVGEEKYHGGQKRDRGSINSAFMAAIDTLADQDPRIKGFVDVMDELRSSEIYNFLNAKTHTMGKKGVFGMEGRKEWESALQNAKDGFSGQMRYMEAGIRWGHLSTMLADAKKVMSAVAEKHPNASALAERYMSNALGFNPSETGRALENAMASAFKATGIGYSYYRAGAAGARAVTNALLLAVNPRFWVTNEVQPWGAMPGMKAMLIARGLDARFDFGTGYTYLAQGADTVIRKNSGEKLDSFEQQARNYALKYHVYGSDMIEHSNRVRKDAIYAADKISNAVAGNIESHTRQLMFYGLAHMLKDNGMKVEHGLFEAAHNLTDMAMNNYSRVDRPQLYNALGPLGQLAVNLSSYKHNELSRLALFARHASEYKSLRPILAQLTSGVVFGGILGTTGFAGANELVKFISKMMGHPVSLVDEVMKLSENLNKKVYDATNGKVNAPYVLSHGVFSMAGVDMSKAIGLNDLVPTGTDLIMPGSSKLGEIASSVYNFTGLPGSTDGGPTVMNAKRVARAMSPIGTQGTIDNQWFTKDAGEKGKLALRPRDLAGQAYRNKTDTIAKYAGFTGINEAVQRQKVYEVETISRDYADLRQKPLGRMRDELFSKGQISTETINDYLNLRGDPKTLNKDIERYAVAQNLSAAERSQLQAAASQSVGAQKKALDYLKVFGATK